MMLFLLDMWDRMVSDDTPSSATLAETRRDLTGDVFASVRYVGSGDACFQDQMMVLDGATPARDLIDLAEALLVERGIADRPFVVQVTLLPRRAVQPDMDFSET
jgi:hypothetical protein